IFASSEVRAESKASATATVVLDHHSLVSHSYVWNNIPNPNMPWWIRCLLVERAALEWGVETCKMWNYYLQYELVITEYPCGCEWTLAFAGTCITVLVEDLL
ncbi:MAG: hypothetical protein AAF570_19440, partial [Bacteroidota bacterium]